MCETCDRAQKNHKADEEKKRKTDGKLRGMRRGETETWGKDKND